MNTVVTFICPQCGRESAHPEDMRHRYCGACHVFWERSEVVAGFLAGEEMGEAGERLREILQRVAQDKKDT